MKLFSKESPKKAQSIMLLNASEQKPCELAKRFHLKRFQPTLAKVSLAFGGLLLLGSVSGANWSLAYVQTELMPKLSRELSLALDRPIQLGAVQQISWFGIRLGRSVLPATAADADQVTVEAIDIHFNPLQAMRQQQLKLTMTLIRPTAYIDQDPAGNWLKLKLKFAEDAPIEIEQIRLQNATVTLAPQPVVLDPEPLDPGEVWDTSNLPTQMTLRQVNGQFSLQEQGQRLVFDMAAQPHEHGTVKLTGDLRSRPNADQLRLAVRTDALQIKSLMPFVPNELKLDDGVLNANVKVQIEANQPPHLSGTAELRDAAARAKGEPNPFTGINGRFQFQGKQVLLRQGKLRFGQIPFQLAGKIDLQNGFDLKARVPELDVAPFMQTLQLKVPFPVAGSLKSDDLRLTGALDQPVLSGTATAATPIKFDRLTMAATYGKFSLALREDHLLVDQLRLQPVTGGSISAQGEAWLETDDATINAEIKDLSADAVAQLYRLKPAQSLGQLNAAAQITMVAKAPSLTAGWQLDRGHYPAQGTVTLAKEVLRLQDTVIQVGDGRLAAEAELNPAGWQASLTSTQVPLDQLSDLPGRLQGHLELTGTAFNLDQIQGQGQAVVDLSKGAIAANLSAAQGRWQMQVNGSEVPLSAVAENLSGSLNANINLQGKLAALNLAGTQAAGKLQLLNGIEFIDHPITAEVAWNGEKLHIKPAEAQDVAVDGWVTPLLIENNIAGISDLDLDIDVHNYDLTKLPITQALPVAVTGIVNLKGKVSGMPTAPQISSDVQLDRFAVQGFQFEPLRGQIRSQPDRQIRLDLRGKQDQIALTLAPNYRPAAFLVQVDQAKAEGQLVGNRLLAQIQNFALAKLQLAPVGTKLGTLRGMLAATVEANLAQLDQPAASAVINISQPGIGNGANSHYADSHHADSHQTDRLSGTVSYRDGAVALSQGVLQLSGSQYRLAAQRLPNAQWSGEIATERGNFADWLSLVSPEDLTALLQQIAPASQTPEPAAATPLPIPLALPKLTDLTQLEGTFAGAAKLESSAQGMAVQFGLQGQDWRLADYGIRQLSIANAQFNGTTLTLPSVQAEGFAFALAGRPQQLDARLGFSGQVAADLLSGRLQLTGITLPQLQTAFNLPVPLNGSVDAVAALSGSPSQPNVTGELHLQGVNVRDMPVQEAKVGFSYIDRQFHLESWQSLTSPTAASPPSLPTTEAEGDRETGQRD